MIAVKSILLERIYDDDHQDGFRVLVDRVWPRGVTKQRASLDAWCKALTPSPALRKWFGHKPEHWEVFQQRYLQELQNCVNEARALLQEAGHRNLVLVYGAKDKAHTHALVLKQFLQTILVDLGAVENEPKDVASPPCYASQFDDS